MIDKLLSAAIAFSILTAGTPEQPAEQVEFCSKLKGNMTNHSAAGFIKTLNDHWRMGMASSGTPEPDTHELCIKRLDELLQLCGVPTERLVHVSTEDRPVGAFDLCTKEQKDANIVVKLKFRKRSCVSLTPLLKCLESTSMDKLYPNEKIMALALTVSKKREATPIEEWIALFFQNGEIVETELFREDLKWTCLTAKEFSRLTFKDKKILEYFKGWELVSDADAEEKEAEEE